MHAKLASTVRRPMAPAVRPVRRSVRPTRVLASATKDAKRQEIMSKYKVWATTKFPEVQGISVAQLSQLLAEDAGKTGPAQLVLVDARNPEEQEVSIIPSRLTLTKAQFEKRQDEFKQGHKIVVYCTAGFRSGLYASTLLKEKGFSAADVYNLEGSILAYALETLPVVKPVVSASGAETVPTKQVHICVEGWRGVLDDAYEPVLTPPSPSSFISNVAFLVQSALKKK